MHFAQSDKPSYQKQLHLLPGVVIIVLQWFGRYVLPLIVAEALIYAVLAGVVGGLAVVIWWVFFSRALWTERLGAIVLMIVALLATSRVVDISIANGMMG